MKALLLPAVALLGACVRYSPQPLDLEAAPAAYQARSLSDPALRAALDSLGVDTTQGWDDWSLAWAAWLMRPERARLAAEVRAAEAGVIAAGGRPAPGLAGGVERTFSGRDGTSPWAVGLSGLFRFEFGGKRDARIARAEAAVLAARARAEAGAWQFRVQVRRRLTEAMAAVTADAAIRTRLMVADHLVAGVERRFNQGAIGHSELARARGERDAIQAEVIALRHEADAAMARLAEESGLSGPPVLPRRATSACDRAEAIAPDSLFRVALTHRPELGVVLAEYQESEGDVRIAAAQSWPDLDLGPGLLYDHGAGKWTIGFGVPVIPTGYRGPLAEAVARREVQAARVAEWQATILGQVEGALRRCGAARAAVESLHPVIQGARERLRAAQATEERGETDAVPVDQAFLELQRWQETASEAQVRRYLAGLDLVAALGVWNREPVTESEETRE